MTEDIAEIAGKLTKAQRVALLGATLKAGKHGIFVGVYRDQGALLDSLRMLRLVGRVSSKLTTLGLAVREYLKGQSQ